MLESKRAKRRANTLVAGHPVARRRIILLVSLMLAPPAMAHPLGNDNIEHVSVLWIMPDRLEVDFLLFIAETQLTRLQKEQIDANKDEIISPEEQRDWLDRRAREIQAGLLATVDGQPVPLTAVEDTVDAQTGKKSASNRVIIEMPGFAGMPTYRLLIRYVARFNTPLARGPHTLSYDDKTYTQNPGLKRIILERIAEIEVLPPHPEFWETDPFRFEQYDPANLPQERSATVRFNVIGTAKAVGAADKGPAGTSPAKEPPASATSSSKPTELRGDSTAPPATGPGEDASLAQVPDRYAKGMTRAGSKTKYQVQADRLMDLLKGRWGLTVFLMVTALSFTWGAAHALMPGHAKTVVAAYLISQSGTYWHAVLLAIVVSVTHTALVVLLGGIWAYYQATNPALGPQLQLWLGLISGLLVAAMGLTLIWRAFSGRLLAHHHHDHDHAHDHPEGQSWFRRLFTHSHPHPPASDHEHEHDRDHPHTHTHGGEHTHDHGHAHAHGHDHEHPHAHEHPHSHEHPHGHAHDHAHASACPPARPARRDQVTGRMILMLGITGGIVPCPTATIIMLLGIGANVVLGALFAVAVFSLGLALTLMLIGFLALSSRRFATRLLSDENNDGQLSGPAQLVLLRIVPALSGLAVIALGLAITANYFHYMRTGAALFGWMG